MRQRLGGLPSPAEAEAIWHGIWVEETHNSTAIEGNTLVLRQVEELLAEGRAVGNRELREYVEVQGYANAANWVYAQGVQPGEWTSGELISLTELRHIHKLALTPVWDIAPHPSAGDGERPGSFREHDIRSFPGGMKPPPWPEVPALIADWLAEARGLAKAQESVGTNEFTDSEDLVDLPELLAKLHARFEQVHPFLDGNGRTGRLVLNLLLIRLGYPPAVIYKRDRLRYLEALRKADARDSGPLGELLARAILHSLHRFVVPAVADSTHLVPLPALASSRISSNALRVAATRGRLRASKAQDGTWRSTGEWVEEYLAGRYGR